MVKKIKLTQDQYAFVDDKNFGWLNKYKWYALWKNSTKSFVAVRNIRFDNCCQTLIYMHREILGLKKGDKRQGDHINHNTLDNRECNLRIATNQQNNFNHKNPKGYSWNKKLKKYQARIGINMNQIHLGCFDSPEEAHDAYLKAKEKYHKF